MASTKLILSRLKRDDRYTMRYSSLVEAIEQLTHTRWDDATSAWLIFHQAPAREIHETLVLNGGIYKDGRDMLVVLDLSTNEYAEIGVDDPKKLDFVLKCGRGPTGPIMRPGR